jgi:hypothetical protein
MRRFSGYPHSYAFQSTLQFSATLSRKRLFEGKMLFLEG